MPIQLNYTDQDSGTNLSASYWVIEKANINLLTNGIDFLLAGYVSLANKNAGKSAFLRVGIHATFGQLAISGGTTLNQLASTLYNYAIANEDFFSSGVIV